MGLFLRAFWNITKGVLQMDVTQLLKKYEVIYLSFEESDEERLKNHLRSLGFDLPEKLKSPVKLHWDRTVSFITGFNEGMLFSSPRHFKKLYPNYLRMDYKKIADEHGGSAWYKCRAQN